MYHGSCCHLNMTVVEILHSKKKFRSRIQQDPTQCIHVFDWNENGGGRDWNWIALRSSFLLIDMDLEKLALWVAYCIIDTDHLMTSLSLALVSCLPTYWTTKLQCYPWVKIATNIMLWTPKNMIFIIILKENNNQIHFYHTESYHSFKTSRQKTVTIHPQVGHPTGAKFH